MKGKLQYLLWSIVFVVGVTLILYLLYYKEYLFEEETWLSIVTFIGFAVSLCGLLITVLLYNYITYDEVKRNLDEEHYLKKKGIKELQVALNELIEVLMEDKLFYHRDLSKQVGKIVFCSSIANNNPNSKLAISKKHLSKLVSAINQCGLCKKHYSEISHLSRKKIIDHAHQCVMNVEIIIESFDK